MDDNARSRLAYLDATEALLWPTADPSAPEGDALCILPSRSKPRLLAPTTPRQAAGSAVLRYSAQQGWLGRGAGLGLAAAVGTGYARRPSRRHRGHALGADSIDAHLDRVLGEPVATSLSLSPERANRKPVLQVFDRAGRTIAFAKVGVGELAAALVENEAAALDVLGRRGLSAVVVPRVLSLTTWHDLPVLVMSALPTVTARRVPSARLDRAMREICAIDAEPAGAAPLGRYVDRLTARADEAAVVAGTDFVLRWRALFDAVLAEPAVAGVGWGSWHGDWTTWNCVGSSRRVAVWDWERFDRGVPLGFDRLHHELNRTVGRTRSGFGTAAPALVAAADRLLRPWGVAAGPARVTALLYVLDVSLRYMADDQRASGGGGTVEEWAFPTVAAALHGRTPTGERRTGARR